MHAIATFFRTLVYPALIFITLAMPYFAHTEHITWNGKYAQIYKKRLRCCYQLQWIACKEQATDFTCTSVINEADGIKDWTISATVDDQLFYLRANYNDSVTLTKKNTITERTPITIEDKTYLELHTSVVPETLWQATIELSDTEKHAPETVANKLQTQIIIGLE